MIKNEDLVSGIIFGFAFIGFVFCTFNVIKISIWTSRAIYKINHLEEPLQQGKWLMGSDRKPSSIGFCIFNESTGKHDTCIIPEGYGGCSCLQ